MRNPTMKRMATLLLGVAVVGGGGFIWAGLPYLRTTDKTRVSEETKQEERYADIARKALRTPLQTPQNTPARASSQELLLEEDFSLITEGTESEPGAEIGSYTQDGNSAWPDNVTHTPGWWGIGTFSINGAVGLCTPGFGGVLTTGPMDMYGNIHVSFRAKAREENGEGKTQSLIYSIISGDDYNPVMPTPEVFKIANLLPEDGWQTIEATFRNPNRNSDSRFQINGATYSKAGFIIDDIKITRDYDFCLPPTAMYAYDFTDDGFTVSWEPGAENNSFLFSLIEERNISEAFDAIETFEDTMPEYWKTSGTISENEGSENSKALHLGADQNVEFAFGGGRIADLSMFIRNGLGEGSTGFLSISGCIEGAEYELATINIGTISAEGQEVNLRQAFRDYVYKIESIKIETKDFGENDCCLIDNVAYKASPANTRTLLIEDKAVEENHIVLTDLDPECEYYVAVAGVKNEEFQSERFGFGHAMGMPAPKATEADEIEKRGAYTARWEASPKSIGYTVSNYENAEAPEAKIDNVVLHEEFANAEGVSQATPVTNFFDEYSDRKGWMTTSATYGLIDAGYVGTFMAPFYSPELSLGNAGGKFTVRFKVKAFGDEIVSVYSNGQRQDFDFMKANPEGDPYSMYEHEVAMTFDNGTDFERLIFTGNVYGTILFDWVEITQDIAKGERLYTYVGSNTTQDKDEIQSRFTGLTNSKDHTYAYRVEATGEYLGVRYMSAPSNLVEVDLNQSGTDDLMSDNNNGKAIITATEDGIEISLSETTRIQVYDIAGIRVIDTTAQAGTNRFYLPSGIYVTVAGDSRKKISIL